MSVLFCGNVTCSCSNSGVQGSEQSCYVDLAVYKNFLRVGTMNRKKIQQREPYEGLY